MTKKAGAKPNSPTGREKLKSYVERIVRLNEEIASLKEDVKDLVMEAKSDGFDPKAIRAIVKESMQTQAERAAVREVEAIIDIYRASLGLLDGTPLGDAARRRYERELRDGEDDEKADDHHGDKEESDDGNEGEDDVSKEPTIDEARERGRADHLAGKRIIENPFQAGSANRAAWDEGYCESDGSDGMDIPKAWRRKTDGNSKEAAQ
ncbi:DUF2312 domain-containing protein [Methylocystis sp. S23]